MFPSARRTILFTFNLTKFCLLLTASEDVLPAGVVLEASEEEVEEED